VTLISDGTVSSHEVHEARLPTIFDCPILFIHSHLTHLFATVEFFKLLQKPYRWLLQYRPILSYSDQLLTYHPIKMQIHVPRNAYARSAGQILAQGIRSPAGRVIRTTTFECADLAYGFEVESLSEKTSSTNTFSPATRELFGIDEVDLNNCLTSIPSPTGLPQQPPTPELVSDYSGITSPVNSDPDTTPEPQNNAGGFAPTGGKSTWPGMNNAKDGAEESENEENHDCDMSGDSQHGDSYVQRTATSSGGKSVRKSVSGFARKSVSKAIQNYDIESTNDGDEGEEEDEDCEYESEDNGEDESDSDYEDGGPNSDSETESVKALPRGGKTFSSQQSQYHDYSQSQSAHDAGEEGEGEGAEQPV